MSGFNEIGSGWVEAPGGIEPPNKGFADLETAPLKPFLATPAVSISESDPILSQRDRLKPLALDFCCGLGGWGEGLIAAGWSVVGFDIEEHFGAVYPGFFIQADVLELTAEALRKFGASLIVASPPCQKYSYMSMPWMRAKQLAAWYREDVARQVELNAIFDHCTRLARELELPLVLENVKGAQPWVGRAKWHYGSYYLWGDVPALMPPARSSKVAGQDGTTTARPVRQARIGGCRPRRATAELGSLARIHPTLADRITRAEQPNSIPPQA